MPSLLLHEYEVRIEYVATSKTHEAIVEEFIFVTGKSAV